jgi:hypothetical protein
MVRMQIAFITLRMVFVLAWTIGNASTLSSQSLYEFHFFCSMPCGIMTLPKSNTVLRCSTTKRRPWSFPVVLISCLYHSCHLGLVSLSCYVQSERGNWVEFEILTSDVVIENQIGSLRNQSQRKNVTWICRHWCWDRNQRFY